MPQMIRTRVRVKKRRVYPTGWVPFWRVVSCGSAFVSMVLACVFLYLLIMMLFGDDLGHWASQASPSLPVLPWFDTPGVKPAAVPEPSRCVLLLVGIIAATLRRRR